MKSRFILILLTTLMLSISACGASQDGEITIYYHDYSQFELVDSQGNRVLIDVYNPDLLSTPATETDILLTTHGHSDHVSPTFINEFPGEQLYIQVGEITRPAISVKGIASLHTAFGNDQFQDENGSNYIYVIDIGGFRIAHFGDIGQDELTSEQLETLGIVDIALTQLVNSFSQMDTNNQKGFNLMEQVKPKLIIPTHGNGNMDAMGYASEIWDAYSNPSNTIVVQSANLDAGTKIVMMGVAANSMKAIFDLPDWGIE